MSIINKMLQDLDQRNGRSGGETMAGEAIRSTKRESPWRLGRNTLLTLIGLVVVSLAGTWWLQQRQRSVDSRPIVVPAPPVPVLAGNAPQAASQVAVAASAAPTTSPAPVLAPAATTHPKVAALAAQPAMASASSPSTPVNAEPLAPPPKTVAMSPMSPKAVSGKTYSPKQVSANLFGEAVALDRQGRQEEAKAPLQRVLAANPLDVQARQMLIQMQLDTGQVEEARALLTEGQRLHPEQSSFTLTLARLKLDSGDVSGSIQLLEAGRAGAHSEPQYHAFLAALLLRVKRYDEAIEHYLVALRSDPANPNWLVGVGVAFEGVGKPADAAEAYRRADGAANLTPEMASFLSERLARLGR